MKQSTQITSASPPVGNSTGITRRRRWLALMLVAAAQFIVILDITVVNIALPSIGSDLTLGQASMTWVVAAYTLTFGGLMLLGGRLADVVGRRRIFMLGLALFTLASVISGVAGNGIILIASRSAQGMGAALLSPAALAIITTTFDGKELHRALGLWAGIGAAGSAVGVLLGGALVAGPGWRWAFFINLPIGLLLLSRTSSVVAADRPQAGGRRIDYRGAALVTTAMAALMFGLAGAGERGWTATPTLTALGVGLALLTGFVVVERTQPDPLLRLKMLRSRAVSGGVVTMLVASGLLIGSYFATSLAAQTVFGLTGLETGLVFLPVALATGIGAQIGGRLLGRFGTRPVAIVGLLAAAVGFAMLAQLSDDARILIDMLPGFALAAAGIGATFVTATTAALSQVEDHHAGTASAVVNTSHELGAGFGAAFVTAVGGIRLSDHLIDGFTSVYLASAIAAALVAVAAGVLLPKGRLEDVSVIRAH